MMNRWQYMTVDLEDKKVMLRRHRRTGEIIIPLATEESLSPEELAIINTYRLFGGKK